MASQLKFNTVPVPELSTVDHLDLNQFDVILLNTSGGKDSQTTMDHVVRSAKLQGFPHERILAVHADLGKLEWRSTWELVQEQCRHYDIPVVRVKRDEDLLDQVRGRGKWPSQSARFCTSDHKRDQIKKVITQLSRDYGKGLKVLNCMGIRAEESPNRALMHPLELNVRASCKSRTVINWLPIFRFTWDQVFSSIFASGVSYSRAYDLGMSRHSCVFCFQARKSELVLAAKQPENQALLSEMIQIEEEIDHTFQNGRSLQEIKAIAQQELAEEAELEATTTTQQENKDMETIQQLEDKVEDLKLQLRKAEVEEATTERAEIMKVDKLRNLVNRLHRAEDKLGELEAAAAQQAVPTRQLTVLSLFDYTGQWAAPYSAAGHDVICIDIKESNVPYSIPCDISEFSCEWLMENVLDEYGTIDVILAAPPCTHFASSGAQYWQAKDEDGRTAEMVGLIYQIINTVNFLKPEAWVFENPVGRLNKLIPGLAEFGPYYFQPHQFGDAYTKKTGLWGEFNRDMQEDNVEPIKACDAGSWLMKMGGKSEATKAARSETPAGFAQAFCEANSTFPEHDDDFYDEWEDREIGPCTLQEAEAQALQDAQAIDPELLILDRLLELVAEEELLAGHTISLAEMDTQHKGMAIYLDGHFTGRGIPLDPHPDNVQELFRDWLPDHVTGMALQAVGAGTWPPADSPFNV